MIEKTSNITKLQKELLIKHLDDMNTRLKAVTEETDYLTANLTAMKMILDNKD